MTEIEYVKAIRSAATAYRAFIADDADLSDAAQVDAAKRAVRKWEHIKTFLSPATAEALCDAWLLGEGGGINKRKAQADGQAYHTGDVCP
jgi:hypothetical protein